jgi:hypothetical protein
MENEFTHLSLFTTNNGRMVLVERSIFPVNDSPAYRFGVTATVANAENNAVLEKWTRG